MSRVATRLREPDDDVARAPVAPPQTAEIVKAAHHEFAEMAPSMLKKNVVALVFLPWLTKYTGSLIRSAKEEERRAILAALPADTDASTKDPHFLRGRNEALKQMRSIIQARSEPALPIESV